LNGDRTPKSGSKDAPCGLIGNGYQEGKKSSTALMVWLDNQWWKVLLGWGNQYHQKL
jgi:hypothetical protein